MNKELLFQDNIEYYSIQKYYPININTIRLNNLKFFSIYIKVVDRFVLYHGGGELLTQEVLNNLIDHNVHTVYIKNSDTAAYNHYLIENLDEILTDKNININERAEIAHVSMTNIAQSLFQKPTLKTITTYRNTVSKITNFILKEDEAISNLIRMSSLDFKLSTHSINVGVFALGLAKALLAHDPKHNMHAIAAGFFLHDIGKCSTPVKILNKTRSLTHDEWKILKQHPSDGYKLLNKFNVNNEEVKTIVMQHHERNSGKGYPFGLKKNNIHIYSKICSIADAFEALTSLRPYRSDKEKNVSSYNALLLLKKEMMQEYEPYFFQQFVLLFRDT